MYPIRAYILTDCLADVFLQSPCFNWDPESLLLFDSNSPSPPLFFPCPLFVKDLGY